HLTVDDDLGIAGDHQGVGRLRRDRLGLAGRVPDDQVARLPLGLLLDLRRPDLELETEGLEHGAPLRRARGEDQSSGNQSEISRAADSGESEPCTRLKVTSVANSPRIEPASASSGFVAPISWRAATTALSPSSTIATSGPPVMNETSSPK